MNAHTPNSADPATVNDTAARQTGHEQSPASLGQSELGNSPTRAQPEHGEVQSCAPRHIEILVDGKRIHSFLAEQIRTSEDRETLTLEAAAWQPEWCSELPPNPARAAIHRAITRINSLMRSVEGVVQRGPCPECLTGAHRCTKDACYCENPQHCGWPTAQTATTEGN